MTESLRRVALIYNPASGQVSSRRLAAVRAASEVFRNAGCEVESFETDGPGSAAVLARQCVEAGFDTVLACGGDGTVHEVMQSLVGTEVSLGVLPLGTANALAASLGLVAPAAKVARKLLKAAPVRIPVGRIHYHTKDGEPASRYFLVAAGIGADALLMSRMDSRLKRRLGYVLYVIEALKIWATDPFPLFEAELADISLGTFERIEVSQLLAVRVHSFGGILGRLAPGATLHSPELRMIAFKTRSRFRYLHFLLAVLVGNHTFEHSVRLHRTHRVECNFRHGSDENHLVEADGEVLGFLPARIEAIPDALNLLVPKGAKL